VKSAAARWVALLPLALIALAFWALAPGLTGSFLFDDHVNLSALGNYGGVRSWRTLALYLTSGLGDVIGRPLSLLSFLIDATNWPASSAPFLRTNILLHLFNGLLLFAVLLRLGRERSLEQTHAGLAAALGTGAWLLHPLFLSTTLYIVQREAMLPATFVLLGMLAWLGGRSRLRTEQRRVGYAFLIIGSFLCTGLAISCKANGVLLPLLLLVTEATVLSGTFPKDDVRFNRARRFLLGIPVAALAVAMFSMLAGFVASAAATRPWSLAQRLLTEPRVLLDYIALLALPRPITRGVFHDDFPVSTDWLHPLSTLPAITLVGICILAAWRLRRRLPVFAFGVLFFFAGHVLESTVVPLELYFEHRNYLPAMMAFWPLGVWLSSPGGSLNGTRIVAAILILVGLAVDTHLGARIWGNPEQLAFTWAARNPDSPRAQAYVAQYEIANGQYVAAERRLSSALAEHPDQTQLAFNLANAQCARGGLPPVTVVMMRVAIKQDAAAARLDFAWLSDAVARARARSCPGLDLETIEDLLQAVRSNPHFANAPGREQDSEHIAGLLALARNLPEQALEHFDQALRALPKPQVALEQAALLGSHGRADLGLQHLNLIQFDSQQLYAAPLGMTKLHNWLLKRMDYWQNEIVRLRATLSEDAAANSNVLGSERTL
jgi:tetratricopeptide (TPR) repeat protein